MWISVFGGSQGWRNRYLGSAGCGAEATA